MKAFMLLALLSVGTAADANPPEDAAHRADRLRTEQLNGRVEREAARRDAANHAAFERYRAASADYHRALDAWRQRSAACEAGYRDACATE